jgi:hypothetical protein
VTLFYVEEEIEGQKNSEDPGNLNISSKTSITYRNLQHLTKPVTRRVQEGTLHGDHPKSLPPEDTWGKIFLIPVANTEEYK